MTLKEELDKYILAKVYDLSIKRTTAIKEHSIITFTSSYSNFVLSIYHLFILI